MVKLKLEIAGTAVEFEGSEEFLETRVLALLEALKSSNNDQVKSDLRDANEGLQQDLASLQSISARMSALDEELVARTKDWTDRLMHAVEHIRTHADNKADLFETIREIQERGFSFNLQFLQLETQMENENRQFTAVSNIIKNKLDTVKNSIENIR